MIRDQFEGPDMAKVLSFVMMFFVMVPALAPSLGQAILWLGNWRLIFVFILLMALVALCWLHLGQPETLARENRIPFTFRNIMSGGKETIRHRATRRYMLAAGITFGAFVGYLTSVQPIFQFVYGRESQFAIYFGGLALVIGASSTLNARLLRHHSMEKVSRMGLYWVTSVSAVMLIYLFSNGKSPPFAGFMAYMVIMFAGMGCLFSNFNAMATRPLGHIAGVASSVISASQTLLSASIGSAIGQSFDHSILPLVAGFFVCGSLALLVTWRQVSQPSSVPSE